MMFGGFDYFFWNLWFITFMPVNAYAGLFFESLFSFFEMMPVLSFYCIFLMPLFLTILGCFFRLIGKCWERMWYAPFERSLYIGKCFRVVGCCLLYSRFFFFIVGIIALAVSAVYFFVLLPNVEFLGVTWRLPFIDLLDPNVYPHMSVEAYIRAFSEVIMRDPEYDFEMWRYRCLYIFCNEVCCWILHFDKLFGLVTPLGCRVFILFSVCLKMHAYSKLKFCRDPNLVGAYFLIKGYTWSLYSFLYSFSSFLISYFTFALCFKSIVGSLVIFYPALLPNLLAFSVPLGGVLFDDFVVLCVFLGIYSSIMLTFYICPGLLNFIFIVLKYSFIIHLVIFVFFPFDFLL